MLKMLNTLNMFGVLDALKKLGTLGALGALKALGPLGSARGGRNFWWSALGTRNFTVPPQKSARERENSRNFRSAHFNPHLSIHPQQPCRELS
jgi:hypothetical protein